MPFGSWRPEHGRTWKEHPCKSRRQRRETQLAIEESRMGMDQKYRFQGVNIERNLHSSNGMSIVRFMGHIAGRARNVFKKSHPYRTSYVWVHIRFPRAPWCGRFRNVSTRNIASGLVCFVGGVSSPSSSNRDRYRPPPFGR